MIEPVLPTATAKELHVGCIGVAISLYPPSLVAAVVKQKQAILTRCLSRLFTPLISDQQDQCAVMSFDSFSPLSLMSMLLHESWQRS